MPPGGHLCRSKICRCSREQSGSQGKLRTTSSPDEKMGVSGCVHRAWCSCLLPTRLCFPCFCLFVCFYKFIYFILFLFLAVLGLRCCMRVFSSCGKRGLLFVAVRGLPIAVASLVAEHRL